MAELATIARPYAEALFKSCQANGQDPSGWLDPLASAASNPQLLQFADNPKVAVDQVFEVLSSVAGGALPDYARNFARAVIENGRLSALPEIAAQVRALRNALKGSSDALVYSAFGIGDAQLAELGATLEKRFARKLNLKVAIDPSLIGGVRVVVGDEVLDTSVKARLEQMKVALTA